GLGSFVAARFIGPVRPRPDESGRYEPRRGRSGAARPDSCLGRRNPLSSSPAALATDLWHSGTVRMTPKRPTAALVMAILNFVFGGLGLFCALCQGGSLALMGNMDSLFGRAGTPNPMADMINQVPGFLPFSIFQHACNLVLSICLIAAGFGLLKM